MKKYDKILRNYSEYESAGYPLSYYYSNPSDYGFDILRDYLHIDLDKNSDLEIAHILLNYVFNCLLPGNDDYPNIKDKCNSLYILENTKSRYIKSNCYMYCVVLTELLLCYGIKSRLVICRPFDFYRNTGCHCMVHAYIKQLEKWIALDPANCASFRDDNGEFISISEIRRKIIDGKKYHVFCSTQQNSDEIKNYLQYYLFAFFSLKNNGFNQFATSVPNEVNALLPLRFKKYIDIIPNIDITFNEFSFWNN